jgi:hypothetical protein
MSGSSTALLLVAFAVSGQLRLSDADTATGLVLLLYQWSRLLSPVGRMSGEWRSMFRFARRSNQILQASLELH